MKLRGRLIVAAAIVVAGGALAGLSPNQTVFIKAKNTKLLKTAKPDADSLLALQPGAEVSWQKAEGKEFHQVQVKADGKTGYVFFSNLSLKKPEPEVLQGKGAVDAQTFASSGAATKALAPAAQDMEKRDVDHKKAVHDLLAAEALTQEKATESEIAAHAKTAGLNQVVGGGK